MGVSVKGWGSNRYWRVVSPFAPAIALVAVQLVFFGMPLGAWVRGVVLGLLTALLAMGMALVYRANRVVNFAQADLGFVPTSLAVGLIVFSGLPVPARLRASAWRRRSCSVRVVELAFVRRFRKASRLVLTVATIGITQLLVVLALLVPRLWGETAASQRIPPPFDWKLDGRHVHPHRQRPDRPDRRAGGDGRRRPVPRPHPHRHGRPRRRRAQRTGADARHPRRPAVDTRLVDRGRALVPRPVPAGRHPRRAARARRSASSRWCRRSPRWSSAGSGTCRPSRPRPSRSASSSTASPGTPRARCWPRRSWRGGADRAAPPAPPVQPRRHTTRPPSWRCRRGPPARAVGHPSARSSA